MIVFNVVLEQILKSLVFHPGPALYFALPDVGLVGNFLWWDEIEFRCYDYYQYRKTIEFSFNMNTI